MLYHFNKGETYLDNGIALLQGDARVRVNDSCLKFGEFVIKFLAHMVYYPVRAD
jgi:hypothetical protein